MFFQSKKKRLWRARVPQQTATHHANQQQQTLQSQQRHHHSHQNYFQSDSQKLINYSESENVVKINHHYHHHFHSKQRSDGGQQCVIDGQENVTSGCYYASGEGEMSGYEDDQTMSSVTSCGSSRTMTESLTMRTESIPVVTAPTTMTSPSMAATAANVLLNCCGGGSSGSAFSSSYTNLNVNNNNNENPNQTNANEEKQLFRGLLSKLKESQMTTLCQVVEKNHLTDGGGGHQPECILVPRGTILGEEPNVIACRLWRWPDIRDPAELKSIPSCKNEKDRVYVCCNPSHWSRVLDTPPPPYQVFAADRLKPEDRAPSENPADDLRVQFPESLTTDGEESSTSSTWCQLAYWELSKRVGGRFPVENSSVNVFSDQPQGDGMCLKTLAEQRQSETPESVLKARQKIGLGVTLSQEADGVWLYNRSSVPVFVHSPTLNDVDNWSHVSKVPPGYCLRAFDSYRAKSQHLVWPSQIAGAQTGPVDTYSMRISFAKGWGPNYSRQDVTGCPCWLEVLLTRR